MKKIFIGIGLLAVFIVGMGIYVASNLGSMIKAAIEEYGSQAAGAPVTVGSVDIELGKRNVTIDSLSLGNPPGFNTSNAFDTRRISVTLAPGWEKGDAIIIDEILIDQPNITYELGSESSNFAMLEANMRKSAGTVSANETRQDSHTKPSIIINNFRIQNGEIAATAALLGGKTLSVPLPDLHVTDIGKDKDGIKPDEVAHQVLYALESAVTKAVGLIDLGVVGNVAKEAEEKLNAISKNMGGRAGQVVDGVGAAADDLGKNLDNAGDAVKSLFGN